MDDTYADSSFLLKLYLSEAESFLVDEALSSLNGRVLITQLTDLEVISSLRRRLSVGDGALATQTYLANRAGGLFRELQIDAQVFAVSLQIAQEHSKRHSLKSLDILHIATALRYGVQAVATFDKNMRHAAQALGLAVVPA